MYREGGRMGFVGSGMRCRRFHNFSKSSRNWCEKITVEPTKIRQTGCFGNLFFYAVHRGKLACIKVDVMKKNNARPADCLSDVGKAHPQGIASAASQFFLQPTKASKTRYTSANTLQPQNTE